MTDNLIELDRRATGWTAELVATATDADWSAPTPCGEWDLRALLEHCVAQNRGFAAAATGGAAEPADWAPVPLTGQPHAEFVRTAAAVTEAYRAPGVLDGEVYLAEFGRSVPGRTALSFHLVDYVAHGWDVARALGRPDVPAPELTEAATAIAELIPDSSRGPGASFGHRVDVAPDAPPHHRLMGLLGRSPNWARPSTVD